MNPYDILVKPVVTERTMQEADAKKYTFNVKKEANKYQIKEAIGNFY